MSWLFSRALVAEYSADTSLDGEQSVPSNGTITQLAFLSPDKMTEFSRLSRFGMTFKPLTESLGADLLMSYLADFLVKTSAQLGREQESKEVVAACGSTWPESSARFCLDTSSWKTAHCLWEEVLQSSSVILPRWGMTRNGHVYQHPTATRPIRGTASGLWQTPTVSCAEHPGQKAWKPHQQLRLTQQVNNQKLWPTQTVNDSKNSTLPTSQINRDNIPGAMLRDVESAGGQLNPEWVEWLMGWPLGWTGLKPLEMGRFREWQQQHGSYFMDDKQCA